MSENLDETLAELEVLLNRRPSSVEKLDRFLTHDSPIVRKKLAKLIWDYPKQQYVEPLFQLASEDPKLEVRKRAILTMGRFIHEGSEMLDYDYPEDERLVAAYDDSNSITSEQYRRIKSFLLGLVNNEEQSLEERRSALESIAFCSVERVVEEIERAYDREHPLWKASALFSMGRHGHTRWEPYIKDNLDHENVDVQREAVRATAELRLGECNGKLIELIRNGREDIPDEALAALAQIGSSRDGAFEFLEDLARGDKERFGELGRQALERWEEEHWMHGQLDDWS
ncbi:MAG: HEAT repeat domain-containing protein [bacterium]